MTSPTATTPARLLAGSIMLHSTRHARITPCRVTIQARRWPSLAVSQGTRSRSISGAHRKLTAYTPKISPAQPMAVRLRPSSFSQRLSALPIRTQGNPLTIPSRRMRAMRRSK